MGGGGLTHNADAQLVLGDELARAVALGEPRLGVLAHGVALLIVAAAAQTKARPCRLGQLDDIAVARDSLLLRLHAPLWLLRVPRFRQGPDGGGITGRSCMAWLMYLKGGTICLMDKLLSGPLLLLLLLLLHLLHIFLSPMVIFRRTTMVPALLTLRQL
jgi:hypothetical protein